MENLPEGQQMLDDLEQYIIENVHIKKDVESQFLLFRVIKHASNIIDYLEGTVINKAVVSHNVIEEDIENALSNLLILAVHYVPQDIYIKEISGLKSYSGDKMTTLELPVVVTSMATLINTVSRLVDNLPDPNTEGGLDFHLILNALKLMYTFTDTINLNIDNIRTNIYEDREQMLRTTTDIIKGKDTVDELKDYYTVNIITFQGLYRSLQITKGTEDKEIFDTGDIIIDFFNCTRSLRDRGLQYRYSEKLFDYFLNREEVGQAFITEGKLRLSSSMTEEEVAYHEKNQEAFEKNHHHVLITEGMTEMDDFLDYLFSKNKEGGI